MRIGLARHSGDSCIAVIEGLPSGIDLDIADAQTDLDRVCEAYLSGLAPDAGINPEAKPQVRDVSGLVGGLSAANPLMLEIDFSNTAFAAELDYGEVLVPRYGTADLAGFLRANADDCSSAQQAQSLRLSISRAAAVFAVRAFLAELGIELRSFTTSVGSAELRGLNPVSALRFAPLDIETSALRCPDPQASRLMEDELSAACPARRPLGGGFALVITGCVPGLGSLSAPQEGLSARLSAAVFSAPFVSSVEFGSDEPQGPSADFDDFLRADRARGFVYERNMLGGVSGGMSSGAPIVASAKVRPPFGFARPVASMNLNSLEPAASQEPRPLVCAAPFASVCAESEAALAIAQLHLDAFGDAPLSDLVRSIDAYRARIKTASR